MISAKVPPGTLRPYFAFERLKQYSPTDWNSLKQAHSQQIDVSPVKIEGSDFSQEAITGAANNLSTLNQQISLDLDHYISFSHQDALSMDYSQRIVDCPNRVTVVSNLPYGKRMELQSSQLYQTIKQWKKSHPQVRFAILTSDPDFKAYIEPDFQVKLHSLFNGRIECWLHLF